MDATAPTAVGSGPLPATDGFAAYAVTTRSGPHVTVQAGVVQSGRFITTTSRSSLKAKAVRRHGSAAVVLEHRDTTEVLAGATVSVDLRHPEGILLDPSGALIAGPAALRLAGGQLEQLLGYVEAAGSVPSGWLPHNRVLLVTRIDRSLRLRGFALVDAAGDWAGHPGRPDHVLVAAEREPGALPPLPDEVAPLVHEGAPARTGVATASGPAALPARWRGEDRFDVSAAALARLGAELPGRGCVTFDDSGDRRPDRKRGVMLRGAVHLTDVDRDRATVAVRTDRITTWDGFSARTVDAPEGSAVR